jgi:two-component system, OmpR family, phosphate regulon sensor histidine kinase PhoR
MRSIMWKIAIPYMVLTTILITAIGGYFAYTIRQTYIKGLEAHLLKEAQLIASEFSSKMQELHPDAIDAQLKIWSNLTKYRYTIVDAEGEVVGESFQNRTTMENHLDRPEIIAAEVDGQGSAIRFSETLGYEMMYTAVPIQLDGKILGFVRIAVPVKNIQNQIGEISRILLLTALIAILASILLALWISLQATRPLRKLTQAANQISRDLQEDNFELSPITPTSFDEIGDLTHAFNAMTAQLQKQLNAAATEKMKTTLVLNEMSDGVLIIDEKSLIQLINPAVLTMFDIQTKDILGQTLVEIVRRHEIVEIWQKSRKSRLTETTMCEVGSPKRFLQVVVTPLDQFLPGKSLILLQNLTEIKRLEKIRRDFISNVSHELRTPLASLKALTETLQENALDDPPAARIFLQRMETEVDALSLMVNELLELSRIDSGRVPLKLVSSNPLELVENAVERLSLQAERSGLTVTIDVLPDVPHILADTSRMEQVLVNLLHNAIKFTPKGGQIYVCAFEKDENIQFSVQDTGIGIPESDLHRIFERFYKTDRARSSGGTGLGLAIARHLVEAHGGKIWAESQEGFGSTFIFTIPKADS